MSEKPATPISSILWGIVGLAVAIALATIGWRFAARFFTWVSAWGPHARVGACIIVAAVLHGLIVRPPRMKETILMSTEEREG